MRPSQERAGVRRPPLMEHDPNEPFTSGDLKKIQLAIDHLQEFYAGFVFIERLRRLGLLRRNWPLRRFFEHALIFYLDGLYPPDRDGGLLPVIRLLGFRDDADEIEAALDARVGGSTFAALLNIYRDKVLAHPQFSARAMKPFQDAFQEHVQNPEDIDAFILASGTLKTKTAAIYRRYKLAYRERPSAGVELGRPVDNSP
jgi:hypothetical protein